MSCPDWRTLVAARDAAPGSEPAAWEAARRHAAHCSRCREEALAAEPLLLFARLPERRVAPGEIDDMQSAVAALVRASRVAQVESGGQGRQDRRNGGGSGLISLSRVAAAFGVCSLLALSGAPRPHALGLGPLAAAGSAAAGQAAAGDEARSFGSVVEELDRPGARIYQLPQTDMAVVMIVDASLDV